MPFMRNVGLDSRVNKASNYSGEHGDKLLVMYRRSIKTITHLKFFIKIYYMYIKNEEKEKSCFDLMFMWISMSWAIRIL